MSAESSLSKAQPLIITGAAKPNGSKRLLTVDNTPRPVNGLSLTATLNVKVSESMFQHKQKVHRGAH